MRGLLALLFPARRSEYAVEEASFEQLAANVAPVVLANNVLALLPFRDPVVHALIVEMKYYNNRKATEMLARVLADYVLECSSEETALYAQHVHLVPLPLSGKRKRERGYNQAEALCRTAALIDVTVDTNVLRRIRHTSTQTSLSKKEREENMEGAFEAVRPDPAHLYIVVDDVVTTGTTLAEAVRALKAAGAIEVRAVALAH